MTEHKLEVSGHTYSSVNLSLTYRHGWGKLSPYLDGLQRGKLWGTKCEQCGNFWVPPRRICLCGCSALQWQQHVGQGIVRRMTHTKSAPIGREPALLTFVIVQFENTSAAALANLIQGTSITLGQEVEIAPCGFHLDRPPTLQVRAKQKC